MFIWKERKSKSNLKEYIASNQSTTLAVNSASGSQKKKIKVARNFHELRALWS